MLFCSKDIASVAFEELKKQPSKTKKSKSVDLHTYTYMCDTTTFFCHRSQTEKQSLSQSISRFIADLLFSVVLEMLFLIQVYKTDIDTAHEM